MEKKSKIIRDLFCVFIKHIGEQGNHCLECKASLELTTPVIVDKVKALSYKILETLSDDEVKDFFFRKQPILKFLIVREGEDNFIRADAFCYDMFKDMFKDEIFSLIDLIEERLLSYLDEEAVN